MIASESDPAHSVLKRVVASSRVPAQIVIAGAPEACSEKVNNLRAAVEGLPPEFEILVFADSDGRPGKSWLHKLVAPLQDSRIGATSTMRWFIPTNNSLATALLAAWNAPVVSMLGAHTKNFCWGGGTAIRRTIFEEIGMMDVWQYAFSDDYSLTTMIEQGRRFVVFLPECFTVSYVRRISKACSNLPIARSGSPKSTGSRCGPWHFRHISSTASRFSWESILR